MCKFHKLNYPFGTTLVHRMMRQQMLKALLYLYELKKMMMMLLQLVVVVTWQETSFVETEVLENYTTEQQPRIIDAEK